MKSEDPTEMPALSREKKIVQLARRMAAQYHYDIDALYVSGEAERVSVPGSLGHIIDLNRTRPLWTAYLNAAHAILAAEQGGLSE
jgi:hypothetical protein